jgi:glycine oxidase
VEESSVFDYIIVGQGLAGSAVALQLLKRSKRILVIDEVSPGSASRIAAGLFNPFTGKGNVKTWMADELFPYLHDFYTAAEKITGSRFFYPQALYKPFASVLEQNEWMGKSEDKNYSKYIEAVKLKPVFSDGVNDQFGGLLLKQCGYLHTTEYLKSVQAYIHAAGTIVYEHFNDDLLTVADDHIHYKHYRSRKIILCQGEHATRNKWSRDLPILALKGETLTIKTGWQKDVILNRGVYMVPGGVPGEFRVGATYKLNDQTPAITSEGRLELEEKLKELVRFPYEVLDQAFGFRPSTPDRRPILGPHAKCSQIIIFNGLGTKGVSLAPYFSDVLIRWLENNETLNKQVSITRYK